MRIGELLEDAGVHCWSNDWHGKGNMEGYCDIIATVCFLVLFQIWRPFLVMLLLTCFLTDLLEATRIIEPFI